MRNLSKTIAAVSLLVPASAYSLGIGDIQLHSALNQNLDAEIGLMVSPDEDISNLKVRLASPDKFEEAGIPWNYFLSKIKFEPVTMSDGSTIVKLSSREAFREPFLDFLLEVSWDKGNIYREFTVLLDPPVAYSQPVVPIVNKASQAARVEKETAKNVPSSVKEAATKAFQGQQYAPSEMAVDQYGPTKRNESVWNIAKRVNALSDVSREQMMMALYKANPHAFSNNNINSLLVGKKLEIPTRNDILSLSRKEATQAFKKQADEWAGYVVSKQSVADSKKQDSKRGNAQLDLKAPTEAQITATDNIVSKGGNDSSESAGENVSSEARNTIDKLEQQVSMMQKLLVIKNEQIAKLQNENLVKDDGVTQTPKDSKISKGIETSKDPEASKEVDQSGVTTSTQKDQVKVAEVDPKVVEPKKVVEKAESKPVTDIQAKAKAKAESDGGIFSSEMLALIGVPLLGLLGWFFWRKRKADEELDTESMFASATEISLPKDNDDEELFASSEDDVSSFYETIDVENSLLSEFASSDLNSFDTEQTEVDPILEADVYLAYGRYQQAEELMREAIVDQPERDECKLKLLEILHANENVKGYEEYAAELMDAGKHDDTVFWGKVVEMGVEINPESEFFAQDVENKATFEIDEGNDDSTRLTDEVLNDSLFTDSSEENEQGELSENSIDDNSSSENEMEFDLSIFDEDDSDTTKEKAEVSEDKGLDFDLDEFDLEKTSKKEESSVDDISDIAVEAESLGSSEFDFDAIMADDSSSNENHDNKVDENEFEDFDFDSTPDANAKTKTTDNIALSAIESQDIEGLDFSLDDGHSSEIASSALENSKLETEKFNLFDLDEESDASSAESDEGKDPDGISELGSMDEMETKVDLAKAYIDMGDNEAARNIAEEVLLKGNKDQKKSAQSIIDQLLKV